MTAVDFASARRPAAPPVGVVAVIVDWIAARRMARLHRAAVQRLEFAPDYLLRDLGITRHELFGAVDPRGR